MGYKRIKKLPRYEEIIATTPLSAKGHASIEQHRKEIQDILSGKDNRLLIIVGPCSAWPYSAVLRYAQKLFKLSKLVENKLKLVMRLYIQKPRTIKGWAGPVNQPDPLLPPNIEEGIKYARGLMVAVSEIGLAIADEALFTHNSQGFVELLSWVAIGARSSEDQEHRIHASALDCPVGIKNPTHGSLKIGVNGIIAAQHVHTAILGRYEIETTGNPYAHLVLRGGDGKPNFSIHHLEEAKKYLVAGMVENPAIIIDVSHDNCIVNGNKDYHAQSTNMLSIIDSIAMYPELKKIVKGFMLESFILEGNQNIEKVKQINTNGLSITDPCLSFQQTEDLLLTLAEKV